MGIIIFALLCSQDVIEREREELGAKGRFDTVIMVVLILLTTGNIDVLLFFLCHDIDTLFLYMLIQW